MVPAGDEMNFFRRHVTFRYQFRPPRPLPVCGGLYFTAWVDRMAEGPGFSGTGSFGDEDRQRDAFARLFAQHDRWLFAYLVSLLGSSTAAEEVFQEVCVVLWREHESFQLGTDFVRWVSVIAHHQVQRYRRQRRRVGPQLSDTVVDLLAHDAVERVDLLESRRDALRGCLEKLGDNDRRLVEQCYGESRGAVHGGGARGG